VVPGDTNGFLGLVGMVQPAIEHDSKVGGRSCRGTLLPLLLLSPVRNQQEKSHEKLGLFQNESDPGCFQSNVIVVVVVFFRSSPKHRQRYQRWHDGVEYREADADARGCNGGWILGANRGPVMVLPDDDAARRTTGIVIVIVIVIVIGVLIFVFVQGQVHRQPVEGQDSVADLPPCGVPALVLVGRIFRCFMLLLLLMLLLLFVLVGITTTAPTTICACASSIACVGKPKQELGKAFVQEVEFRLVVSDNVLVPFPGRGN
jgi:hypothetical protein